MSIAYLVGFRLRDGQRERFLDLLTAVMDAMRHEATYRAATLHADPDDPTRFLLHEIWADHDDVVNVQLHRPYRRAWHAALPELLREERRIEVWRPVEP
ncbi:putative quinol monooxygenase [Methylobacterium indicum]|uniref:Antibiotic biosynthesis monooxygenase n=1 Tax=Methylobacterium indicum TaxID=1775910 RepID=A0A8H9C9H6_9HYPH|nr:putative quinol monooxygenase [Methylobacterium indicum]BCM87066.1 antibiotic biosynthesis monooxygenase [Methylobacterium indicum]